MLKNTRDYSFLLSDDAGDVPAPSKASLPQKSSAPHSGISLSITACQSYLLEILFY